ncbi:centriole, cilia and spindle-associated protein [Genypterus blacodes]|uniref:centriole, cilia and spindle-associated protein n=1 Tax=Genypterus blacodes TaxID=154954 RepID=UPI003F766225
MVTKRIRSEYMKKFKDPKWETFYKCYEDMLMYRLTRRLLEQSHNPWFWSGSDTDSDSGGAPAAPSKNQNQSQVQADPCRGGPEAELEECAGARADRQQEGTQAGTTAPIHTIPIPEEEEDTGQGCQHDGAREVGVLEGEREEQRGSKQPAAPLREMEQEKESAATRLQQVKSSKSSKPTWRTSRVRPAPSQAPIEDSKERRHPFVLYGSGEKDANTSGKKTHNVGPVASTTEIHESALRAKTRREVERQVQAQRVERRRTKSADVNKKRAQPAQPEFNPWLTEYMRCFSARTR